LRAVHDVELPGWKDAGSRRQEGAEEGRMIVVGDCWTVMRWKRQIHDTTLNLEPDVLGI